MEADFSIWALLMSYFGENFCLNSLPLSELTWGPLGEAETGPRMGAAGGTLGRGTRSVLPRPWQGPSCVAESGVRLPEAGAGGRKVGAHLCTCSLLPWLLHVRLWLSRFPHCASNRVLPHSSITLSEEMLAVIPPRPQGPPLPSRGLTRGRWPPLEPSPTAPSPHGLHTWAGASGPLGQVTRLQKAACPPGPEPKISHPFSLRGTSKLPTSQTLAKVSLPPCPCPCGSLSSLLW